MDERTLYSEESARYLYLIAVTLIILSAVEVFASDVDLLMFVFLPILAVIAGLLYYYKRKYCRISDGLED